MSKLVDIGPHAKLDIDKLIAGRLLIQGNSGGGKSYAVRKLCEVTHGHAQQIIIDVDGEYHTLREKFDYVLAGKDGDCAADIKSAALLARRLLELNVSAILDIYELGIQRSLFIKRFLDSLINAPRELWHPVIVIVDEAHKWAPESSKCESTSAVVDLMTLGRKRGFAGVLATQRISKLSKDAAAECNLKLIGRSSIDIDMKRSAEEIGMTSKTDMWTLRKLEPGQFYAIGFEAEHSETLAAPLIRVGKTTTTHLKAGQQSVKPATTSAKVKKILGQLDDLPHEAEEELKTVGELRLKVKQLENELRKKPEPKAPSIKVIEKRLLSKGDITRLEKTIEKLDGRWVACEKFAREDMKQIRQDTMDLRADLQRYKHEETASLVAGNITRTAQPVSRVVPSETLRIRSPVPKMHASETSKSLAKGPAALLTAIIQHDSSGCTETQLAVLTGYKATSRYEFLRQLRALGYTDERGERVYPTEAGRNALPNVQPLPTGEELRRMSLERVSKGERMILELAIDHYPDTVTKDTILERTGYKPTSVYEFTRQLFARELLEDLGKGEVKASATLFE